MVGADAAAAPEADGRQAPLDHRIQFNQAPEDSRDCRYAEEDAATAAFDLASEARGLAACAERRDFTDSCVGEFWRLGTAQSEYESAVAAVRYACR